MLEPFAIWIDGQNYPRRVFGDLVALASEFVGDQPFVVHVESRGEERMLSTREGIDDCEGRFGEALARMLRTQAGTK